MKRWARDPPVGRSAGRLAGSPGCCPTNSEPLCLRIPLLHLCCTLVIYLSRPRERISDRVSPSKTAACFFTAHRPVLIPGPPPRAAFRMPPIAEQGKEFLLAFRGTDGATPGATSSFIISSVFSSSSTQSPITAEAPSEFPIPPPPRRLVVLPVYPQLTEYDDDVVEVSLAGLLFVRPVVRQSPSPPALNHQKDVWDTFLAFSRIATPQPALFINRSTSCGTRCHVFQTSSTSPSPFLYRPRALNVLP